MVTNIEKYICIKPSKIWWQGSPMPILPGEKILVKEILIQGDYDGKTAYSINYKDYDHPFGLSELELKSDFIPISEWRNTLIDNIIKQSI